MRKLDHEYALALLLELSPEEGKKKIMESRVHTLSSYSKVKVCVCAGRERGKEGGREGEGRREGGREGEGKREREREGKGKREGEREGKGKREGGREGEREGRREGGRGRGKERE